ncbi:MAG: hypothetical protein U1F68_20305 [Gammaproteobacteria bacterium]
MTTWSRRWWLRSAFWIGAAVLAWRIVCLQLASHFAGLATPAASASALDWYSGQPWALYQWARRQLADHPEEGAEWLQRAARANPSDGRVYALLAAIRAADGHWDSALELADSADHLAPMRGEVQRELALLHARLGRVDSLLRHLMRAIDTSPDGRRDLFAQLLALLDDPGLRARTGSLITPDKRWQPEFFAYAAEQARGVDVVEFLYRSGSSSIEMRRQIIARYQREQRWIDAYLAWIDGLSAQQVKALGNVYDGGFEQSVGDDEFGWHAAEVAGVKVQIEPRPDGAGRALKLTFTGEISPFRDVHQTLLLRPGRYQLRGEARTERLQAVRGIAWVLRCMTAANEVLGSTEPLQGTSAWREFTLTFIVPPLDCAAQDLRLELTGRYAGEFQASGIAWFDNIRVLRSRV